jgi:hypothetical protein
MFGIFVIASILAQCFIPFFAKLNEYYQVTGNIGDFLNTFLNQNFVLPMDIISGFWAAISAAYVGVDRGMFMIDGFKNGQDIGAFDTDKIKHLTLVIILGLAIYVLAAGLNLFFDAELALAPLVTSFGSSVLLYVVGNKAIKASQTLSPENDLDQDGIDDSEQDPAEVLKRLKEQKQNTDK